ncbi:replication protein A 14 kDa subunit-like [Chelonus insularis]|uniref:replication protein A 14 kDa subunit-like n=1 Tax=Chelonus insularis TaxID=460826 RepID=UPI00158D2E93|nr:replication protein A 14 kDa subunit-like [Chelonus insularis]
MATARLHITGKYLPQSIDKNVVIEGMLTKISSDGRSVELTTFDKIKVNVALSQPFEGEPSGIMQIFGTVKSRTTLAATSYVVFPDDDEGFDPEDHNDFTTVLHVTGRQNLLESSNIVAEETGDGTADTSYQEDYGTDM